MRKKVFVGSSHGDRALAEQVCTHLSRQGGVAGICWTTAFPVGLLTFEALERMLEECSGAVFIVSPEADGGPNRKRPDRVRPRCGAHGPAERRPLQVGRSRAAVRSQTVARQRVKHVGDPWPEEGLSEDDVGPWTFRWELEPAQDEPGQMVIRFETDFEEWSRGKGRARKES